MLQQIRRIDIAARAEQLEQHVGLPGHHHEAGAGRRKRQRARSAADSGSRTPARRRRPRHTEHAQRPSRSRWSSSRAASRRDIAQPVRQQRRRRARRRLAASNAITRSALEAVDEASAAVSTLAPMPLNSSSVRCVAHAAFRIAHGLRSQHHRLHRQVRRHESLRSTSAARHHVGARRRRPAAGRSLPEPALAARARRSRSRSQPCASTPTTSRAASAPASQCSGLGGSFAPPLV